MTFFRKALIVIFTFLLVDGLNSGLTAKNLVKYAIATLPTPVLHTADFRGIFGGEDGETLRLDEDKQIKELEFIAFPKTVFKVEEIIEGNGKKIYKITTKDYPYPTDEGYFIDSRFVKTVEIKPPERPKELPSKQTVIQNLLSTEDSNYLWSGNYKNGIPQIPLFYKPTSLLPEKIREKWMLKGLDCSGLLYYATNGCTPRNTSSLVNYGDSVQIAGLKVDEIIQKVESLDIIVWIGHLIIILVKEHIIESRLDYDKHKKGFQGGVKIRQLKEVLVEIMESRVPVDNYKDEVKEGKKKFVIRRWYE